MRNLAAAANVLHPSALAHSVGQIRVPHAARRVAKLPLGLFYILTIFNTLNLGTIYTRSYGSEVVPINPVGVALFAIPILILTKGPRTRMTYFRAAWYFWIAFTVGGFLGAEQITLRNPYRLAQNVVKLWISILGIPWLAARTITEQNLAKYARLVTVLIAAGAILAVAQLLHPSSLLIMTRGGGRGAGFWVDPNLGATMCACGVLLNLMFPFRTFVTNYGLRFLCLLGVGATLSRAGILAALLALLIYGIMLRQWTAILRTVVITALAGVVGFLALEPVKQSNIEGLAERAAGIQNMLQGGVKGQTVQGRWALWQRGFQHASHTWLRGRGHGSMNYAIKLTYLEYEGRWHLAGPHNYYIFVWGNSGLMGLVGFLFFLITLAWIGWKCQVTRIRAGLIALLAIFSLLAMSDHTLFNFQYFGAVFAVFGLAGHYAQRRPPPRTRPVPTGMVGLART